MGKLGVPFDFMKPTEYEKCELVYDFPITSDTNKYLQNGDLVVIAQFDNLSKSEIIELVNDGDMLVVQALKSDLVKPTNIVKLQIVNGNYILSPISDFVDRKTIVIERKDISNENIIGKVLMSFRDFGNIFQKDEL